MNRIVAFLGLIMRLAGDEALISIYKDKPSSFTKDGKIKASDVVFFVLSLMKTTLPLEIQHYVKSGIMQLVVASSITKARLKVLAGIFKEILCTTVKELPVKKTFKGRQVVALDGMQGELPRTKELCGKYGINKKTSFPMFHAVGVYDLLNKIFINAIFKPAPTNERQAGIELILELVGIPIIALLDRGFPSVALIQTLMRQRIEFVMRVSTSFIAEVNDFIRSDKTDEVVYVSYDKGKASKNKVKGIEFPCAFSLRCVKIPLKSGEIEVLITNLWQEEFSKEEIAELYNMRWGIETSFNHLKHAVRVEDFVGKKENCILQEFYGALIFYNIGRCP